MVLRLERILPNAEEMVTEVCTSGLALMARIKSTS
jgi:hypothetical protein